MLCKLHYTLPWQREFGPPVVTIKILQLANKVRESLLEKIVTTLKAYSNIFFFIVLILGRTRKFIPPPWYKGPGEGGIDGTPRQNF